MTKLQEGDHVVLVRSNRVGRLVEVRPEENRYVVEFTPQIGEPFRLVYAAWELRLQKRRVVH